MNPKRKRRSGGPKRNQKVKPLVAWAVVSNGGHFWRAYEFRADALLLKNDWNRDDSRKAWHPFRIVRLTGTVKVGGAK